MDHFSAVHEWDSLWEHSLVAVPRRFGPVTQGLRGLNLYRGDSYELLALLSHDHPSLRNLDGVLKAGEVTTGHLLEAALGNQEQLTLRNAVAVRNRLSIPGDGPMRASADIHCLGASRHVRDTTPELLIEWCLSGPKSAFWHRASRRDPRAIGRRLRGAELDESRGGWTRDHVLLHLGENLEVVFGGVPESFGPEWSNNVCLEYHGRSAMTDAATRKAVLEGIGLFFGRRLLSVGESHFTAALQPICFEYRSPESDARAVSKQGDHRIFAVQPFELEKELAPFLRAYLLRREELDLCLVTRTLWVANALPLGPDLAIMGAALERLMNAWYKSSTSRSGGVYLPKKEFDDLLAPELNAAAQKLGTLPNGDRIIRRMSSCYNMGTNERLQNFFTELALPLSARELDALKSRNYSAHGADPSEMILALRRTRTYRCLIARVILRLLDQQGMYTDYSSPGYPERPVEVPCGGLDAG